MVACQPAAAEAVCWSADVRRQRCRELTCSNPVGSKSHSCQAGGSNGHRGGNYHAGDTGSSVESAGDRVVGGKVCGLQGDGVRPCQNDNIRSRCAWTGCMLYLTCLAAWANCANQPSAIMQECIDTAVVFVDDVVCSVLGSEAESKDKRAKDAIFLRDSRQKRHDQFIRPAQCQAGRLAGLPIAQPRVLAFTARKQQPYKHDARDSSLSVMHFT